MGACRFHMRYSTGRIDWGIILVIRLFEKRGAGDRRPRESKEERMKRSFVLFAIAMLALIGGAADAVAADNAPVLSRIVESGTFKVGLIQSPPDGVQYLLVRGRGSTRFNRRIYLHKIATMVSPRIFTRYYVTNISFLCFTFYLGAKKKQKNSNTFGNNLWNNCCHSSFFLDFWYFNKRCMNLVYEKGRI